MGNEKLIYLIKPGELTLKGGNRSIFEKILVRNLATLLRGSEAEINVTQGRFFVRANPLQKAKVESALNHLLGITAWALVKKTEKELPAILDACIEEATKAFEDGKRTFKIESRRTDKSFPLDSYKLKCAAGDAVVEAIPDFKVDVKNPELVISIEVREKAYVYGAEQPGLWGLPVGTAGRGLLLLSGGIDSPVAGYMMASRGMAIDAVHFHTYPYTSNEALQKVLRLTGIISEYTLSIHLFVINFTEVQMRIKDNAPPSWSTIMLRMAMMQTAAAIAREAGCKCLITGESLSQVASQTIENISCTESIVHAPFKSGKVRSYPISVLRPLIGLDKETIIQSAKKLGTYETSILPFEDCCVLFSPEHPELRGKVPQAEAMYRNLDLNELIEKCVIEKTSEKFPAKA